jgi:RecB family exonuclease
MVLDYKSGRTINNAKKFAEDKLFDVQLQLPLYVAAVHRLLAQTAGKTIDAVYVSLRDTQRSKTLSQATGGATAEQVSERLEQSVREISSRVREGRFPITPRTCIGCHLQPACRIPERRGV